MPKLDLSERLQLYRLTVQEAKIKAASGFLMGIHNT